MQDTLSLDALSAASSVVPIGAKWAFTTRRVDHADIAGLKSDVRHAVSGDLVLAEVVSIGQHKKLQLASGRYSETYVGDVVVMACGDRYAPDQFEGFAEIHPEECDMIAGGGMLGRMVAAHGRMSSPTRVRPLGLLSDADDDVVNIASYGLSGAAIPGHVTVIGVFGASMNAGKTTAAVSLAHGLKKAGYRVAGVKATGTGAFGDFNAFRDAGIPVSDFTDAGMVSTYRMPLERIEQGFETLVGTAAKKGAEIVVVEIADGVFQAETAGILRGSRIRDRFDAAMFAAPDALGAVGGVCILRQYGLEPFTVSGMVTRSPLAVREAEAATGVPMLSRQDLCDPEIVVGPLADILASKRVLSDLAA